MPKETNKSFFNGFPINHIPLPSTFKQLSSNISLNNSTGYQISLMSSPILSSHTNHEIISYQSTNFSLLPNSISYYGYNNIMKRSFQCRICSVEFPTAQAYGGHMSYHSKLKKAQERDQKVEEVIIKNVMMKGKKRGIIRAEEEIMEKKKNFGYGSDESVNSEFYLGEGCSDFKKKRK